jgi:phosphonoacetaldehyde hydrolase
MKRITAVILDWAGTTVDYGSRAPTLAFRQVFQREGVEISEDEARGPMGMAKRDHITAIATLPRVASAWKTAWGRAIDTADIDRMYGQFIPVQKELLAQHSDVIPGVAAAIQQCREWGIAIGSSTGYSRELMDIVAPLAAAQGYAPDCIVCADDVAEGRPSPLMNLRAAALLGATSLAQVLVLDDTQVGCLAGMRAGCLAVGVTQTGNLCGLTLDQIRATAPPELERTLANADRLLRQAGASHVIPSVANLPELIRRIEDEQPVVA